MKVKTSELTGAALDWAVAKCEGLEQRDGAWYRPETPAYAAWRYAQWHPSTDWAQGGPIIEREGIDLFHDTNGGDRYWLAGIPFEDDALQVEGPTPLIAACRCYVASKLGDEIEIPEELL